MIDYQDRNRFGLIFAIHGTVLPNIVGYLIFMMLWSAATVFIFQYFKFELSIGSTAHAIVGVALGLLLVFRTNTSYDRFWEGRKQLGQMTVTTRAFATRANTIIPTEATAIRQEIAALIATYGYLVKSHLREGITTEDFHLLSTELQEAVQKFNNKINGLINLLSARVHILVDNKWIAPPERGAFEQDLKELQKIACDLERIRFTPIPFAYVNQLKVFMLIYFLTLPIAIASSFGWVTIIAIAFIVYALVGIEEIGLEIEDPFGDDPNDLPIQDICQNIEQDVFELLGQTQENN